MSRANKFNNLRVLIITLHTSINYGSLLQTYATQKVFENCGFDVAFIDYCRHNNTEEYRLEQMINNSPLGFLAKYSSFLSRVVLKSLAKSVYNKRVAPFQRFLDEYIHLSNDKYKSFEELCNTPPDADVYVTGSDQVWNTKWNGGIDSSFFLGFTPADAKRISFASSIGYTALSDAEKDAFANLLSKYKAVSVREQSAIKVLNDIGIEAELVVDPTLMLRADQWELIEKKMRVKKPYILLYQLNKDKAIEDFALKFSQQKGLSLLRVRLAGKNLGLINRKTIDIVSPEVGEFIWLMHNANYIITDSFHATVFSMIFHIPFYVFLPKEFSGRLTDILQLTGTEDRIMSGNGKIKHLTNKIDWKIVDEVVREGVSNTTDFLRSSI